MMPRIAHILALISGFLFEAMCAPGQSGSGLIATGRMPPAGNWSGAGATITNRTTQCGSTITAGASAATIQAAITACAGTNQYVLLGPGTFSLSSSLIVTYAGALNVTLRGSGPTNTILKFTGTSTNCNGIGTVAVCITNGDSSNTANGSANTLNWTAGYSAGTTTLTAGSAVTGSLANMHVGTLLYLTQADIGSDNGQWWPCGSTGSNGDCSQQGMENQWPARSISQIVTVTGISGSNITVSPGVYAPDYTSGRTPYMSYSSFLPISGFGLENLTIDTQSLTGSTQAAMVEYGWALNCWEKNVSSINSVSPGGAMHKHVFIGSSQHITVRDSNFYGSSPTMEGYGVDNTLASSDDLVENNIFHHVATALMFESATGNVIGYNFITDNFYVGNPPGSAPNWQGSDLSFHDAGNYYNLIEGNEGIQFSSDDIHGTAFANTLFRSYYNGHDPTTQCPGGGTGCGTGPKTQDTQAVQINSFNRYFNLALNVFGTSTYFTNYQQQGASGSPNSCPATNWTTIYNLNYGASGLTPWSPTCGNGQSWTIDNDSLVSTSLMRWGNYDTVNGSVQTNSSERGNTASTYPGLASPSTTWASYPSLYLSAQPSWWNFPSGSPAPWPAIGPDVAGGNIVNVGGHAYKIPARACFDSLGGALDGSTGSLQSTFDADVCYASTGGNILSTATAGTGSGTVTGCGGTLTTGTPYSCTANASTGSAFTSWSSTCGGTPSGSTYAGNMPAFNCTVTATFTLNTYTLAVSTTGTGSGTLSGANCANGALNYLTSVTCTASATSGTFVAFSGTGSASGCSSSPCTFSIGANSTLQATFSLTASTPTFSPVAGSYGSAQTVTISTTTGSPTIYYTTDGSTPTHSSPVYSAPITVSTSQTVKAIAAASGYLDSAVGSATYTINGAAVAPTFAPPAGTYTSAQSVTASTTTTACSSNLYIGTTNPPTTLGSSIVVNTTETIYSYVHNCSGWSDSTVNPAAYTINLPAGKVSIQGNGLKLQGTVGVQ